MYEQFSTFFFLKSDKYFNMTKNDNPKPQRIGITLTKSINFIGLITTCKRKVFAMNLKLFELLVFICRKFFYTIQ